jgi:hypothetical protein
MLIRYLFCLLVFVSFSSRLFAQGQDKTVLFNARVVSSNGLAYLPLAYVYNPKAGRGALSDNFGHVDLYVFPGDSLVFTYVGYKPQYYVIPKKTDVVHQAVIEMVEDVKMLAEVKVFIHANEADFKKAFLNMKVRDDRQKRILSDHFEQSNVNLLALQAGMGADANFRNFDKMMLTSVINRNFVATPLMTFTNPFAWINFIQSIKKGDLKRKDWKPAFEIQPKQVVSPTQFKQQLNNK